MHRAKATNWNGRLLEVTFSTREGDLEKLCRKAHAEFHKSGKFTIRLDEIDGTEVPVELRYQA
jgi:hypothetical protein